VGAAETGGPSRVVSFMKLTESCSRTSSWAYATLHAVVIADDEAGVGLIDGLRRREAAGHPGR
jgi:hypothetical protein